MILASTFSPALERSRQWTQTCRDAAKCPFRWTRTTASHSSSDAFTNIRSRRKPALFTTTSRRPKESIAVCTRWAAPFQSATSSPFRTASPPSARISSTTSAAGPVERPVPSSSAPRSFTTTLAPWRANSSACARPRPRPAPVTMTTRPEQIPLIAVPASGLAQPFDDGDVRLAAALAHRLEAKASAGPLELVEEGRHEARAGRAERMPEGDRAAVHVHAIEIRTGLALPREDHRGERLVDLDQVDVGELHPGLPERVGGRGDRGGQHPDRVRTADAQVVDPGARLEAVLGDASLGCDQEGGGPVADL